MYGQSQAMLKRSITRYIVKQGLRPGDPLPNEADLMRALGVSRHPLRESVKSLQGLGILEIRPGRGTFVGQAGLAPLEETLSFQLSMSAADDLTTARELLQVREVLELGLTQSVMDSIERIDFGALESAVQTMESEAAAGRYCSDADRAFHRELYKPVDNDLLLQLLDVFWKVFKRVDDLLPASQHSPVTVASWHREIIDILQKRDVTRFRLSMQNQFAEIHQRFS